MAPVNAFDAWMVAHDDVVFGGAIGLIGLICTSLGAAFIHEGRRGHVVARISVHWPTVTGQVITAEVLHRVSFNDGMSTDYYDPQIVYTYEVNGKRYESSRVLATSFAESVNEAWAQEWVDVYYVGRPVLVSYNPKRHGEALLEPGVERSRGTANEKIGCGWSMLLFGIGCFVALYTLLTKAG